MPLGNRIKIPENILQNLKCVKCSLYISVAPVTYDDEENLVCGRCQNLNSSRRAKAFEIIQELLLFPCRYSNNGCPEVLNSSQIPVHEEICEYCPLQCPVVTLGTCDWLGNCDHLYDHCLENHSALILETSTFNLALDKSIVWFLKISSYLFVINFVIHAGAKFITFTVHQISKKYERERFDKYQIEFKCKALSFKICNILYDYRKVRLKQNKLYYVDITFFENTATTVLDHISCEILISNLNDKDDLIFKNLENFKCPKCHLFMKNLIMVCCNGHNFCDNCFNKSKVCPTCDVECNGSRSTILENLVKNTKLSCKNEDQGCNYLGLKNQLKNHESKCVFKKIQCPLKKLSNCVWNGPCRNHIHHLLEHHEFETVLSGHVFKHPIVNKNTEYYWMTCFDNAYFRCCFEILLDVESFAWSFHEIGLNKYKKPSYKMEIEFIAHPRKDRNSLAIGSPCFRFRNDHVEDSIKIPFDLLSPYIENDENGEKLVAKYNVIKLSTY